jgi:hypothetical protein
MAIDTAFKRRSACASRRSPWERRFLPAPTGTIDQPIRQQVIWIYGGILAGAEIPVSVVLSMLYSELSLSSMSGFSER